MSGLPSPDFENHYCLDPVEKLMLQLVLIIDNQYFNPIDLLSVSK